MDCVGNTTEIDYVVWQWNLVLYSLTPLTYIVLFMIMCAGLKIKESRLYDLYIDHICVAARICIIFSIVFFPCLYCTVKPSLLKSYEQEVNVSSSIDVMKNVRCCVKLSEGRNHLTTCSDFCSKVTINKTISMENTTCRATDVKMCLTNKCVNNIVFYNSGTRQRYANPYNLRDIRSKSFTYDNGRFVTGIIFALLSGIIMLLCFIIIIIKRLQIYNLKVDAPKQPDTTSIVTDFDTLTVTDRLSDADRLSRLSVNTNETLV